MDELSKLTTVCYCCGQRTKAETIHALVPAALVKKIETLAISMDKDMDMAVQEALAYWIRLKTPEDKTAE
jgi:hypothetical protein